jgi:hypothetical protein
MLAADTIMYVSTFPLPGRVPTSLFEMTMNIQLSILLRAVTAVAVIVTCSMTTAWAAPTTQGSPDTWVPDTTIYPPPPTIVGVGENIEAIK